MKTLLPGCGIEVIEIPRREMNEAAISASRVRALLEEKNFDQIRGLVPETTYEYLNKTYG
jgi:[citrate (pro-3S)-lyase] ligase